MMKQKIIDGYRFTYPEALEFFHNTSEEELFKLAEDLTKHFFRGKFETCMIMNGKSGNCSENCKWCSQSAKHKTGIDEYPLVKTNQIEVEVKKAAKNGVNMFSIVTSGRKLNLHEVEQVADSYKTLGKKYPEVKFCGSFGLLNRNELGLLYDSGIRRYHCNVETAPSFFSNVCTSHTMDEKIKTLKAARDAGMTLCSGGIMGMGENEDQRIEMAVLLCELGIDSIPVNILLPIKGTPMEDKQQLSDKDILRAFAIFRITNPTAFIRFAAGRIRIEHILEEALKCGVNASLVGDMLTTVGKGLVEDMEYFKKQGYQMA